MNNLWELELEPFHCTCGEKMEFWKVVETSFEDSNEFITQKSNEDSSRNLKPISAVRTGKKSFKRSSGKEWQRLLVDLLRQHLQQSHWDVTSEVVEMMVKNRLLE